MAAAVPEPAVAAVLAEAAAAEAILASKLQEMEAEGLPAWKVQVVEAEEREKICSFIAKKSRELSQVFEELPGMSEAEREAQRSKLKDQCAILTREYLRIAREISTPDYSSMTEAERAAEAEKLRREKLEEVRRLKLEGDSKWIMKERVARIIDFDPKQYGMYFNRMSIPLSQPKFDIDEESPLGPMRFTNEVYKSDRHALCVAINYLSVNIACSDVGFPIQVYGSVLARDSIDRKCVYLFRRDRDDCQLISSKYESLILTGPKRGLVLFSLNYVETDLKIKDHQGQDRELSKGLLSIKGVEARSWEESEVERKSIATRLSTVDLLYAVVKRAVEGTVAIRVIQGKFYGTVTAYTTSVQNKIMLYDSKVIGAKARRANGVIQLMRSVVCVPVMDMLIIDAKTSTGKSACLKFTPKYNGGEGVLIILGATKMRVKLAWSVMDVD